jgi:hypothetical protein
MTWNISTDSTRIRRRTDRWRFGLTASRIDSAPPLPLSRDDG